MFKKPYGDRVRCSISFEGDSLTEQHHKDACDINNILRKYERTGVLLHQKQYNGQYGDFSDVEEYHHCQNRVLEAKAMFDALPAKIRSRFANDPANFLEFVKNPENFDEGVELGIFNPKQVQQQEVRSDAISEAETSVSTEEV